MRLSKRQYECKTSLEFFNSENLFYLENTGFLVCIKMEKTDRNIEHAVKLHLSKKRIDLFQLLDIQPVRCAFCGNRNNLFYPIIKKFPNRVLQIVDIGYRKAGNYCFSNKSCPGKKLNPNSVKFVSAFFGLSEYDATHHIHARNKSPFYRENHESYEDYIKTQRSHFYGRPQEQVQEGIRKILATRKASANKDAQLYKQTLWTYISKIDNKVLCSNGERAFYKLCKDAGIEQEIETNGFYNNSILCFDFFVPKLNLYIEIAGMLGEKYEKRLQEKRDQFGSIVLKSRSRTFIQQCEATISTIKKRLNELPI